MHHLGHLAVDDELRGHPERRVACRLPRHAVRLPRADVDGARRRLEELLAQCEEVVRQPVEQLGAARAHVVGVEREHVIVVEAERDDAGFAPPDRVMVAAAVEETEAAARRVGAELGRVLPVVQRGDRHDDVVESDALDPRVAIERLPLRLLVDLVDLARLGGRGLVVSGFGESRIAFAQELAARARSSSSACARRARRVYSPPMAKNRVLELGEGFWNIRGTFRIAGLLDIGTQASLVRRKSGGYVVLDACGIDPETRRLIDSKTGGGDAIEAILHLHPFHTMAVQALHEVAPRAKLYGTARHHRLLPELPWQKERTEEAALHALFADDFDFFVPRGVDFIPSDERLHFSSVLALHRASKTLHVDDTLNYVRFPTPIRFVKKDSLAFHPSLSRVLERRAGAARDFRAWAAELVERSRGLENLCAAHTSALLARHRAGPSIAERIESATHAVEKKLAAHERRFG